MSTARAGWEMGIGQATGIWFISSINYSFYFYSLSLCYLNYIPP